MDLEGFGPKVLEALWEAGLVRDPADFYRLGPGDLMTLTKKGRGQLEPGKGKRRPPDGELMVAGLPGMDSEDGGSAPAIAEDAPKSAQNLLSAVEASKNRGLARLLVALAIPDVGTTVAHHLARRYGSLASLRAASAEELAAVATGASATYRTLGRKGAQAFMDALAASGARLRSESESSGPPPAPDTAASLADWLGTLAIKGVGAEKRTAVARHFGTLDRLLAADPEEWALVPMGAGVARRTLGPEAGHSLRRYFDDPAHQDLLSRLQAAGVSTAVSPVSGGGLADPSNPAPPGGSADPCASDGPAAAGTAADMGVARGSLAGLTVALTGTLPHLGRAGAKRMLEEAGALVAGSVSGQTRLVVAGVDAGQKLAQARRRGVPVIDEAELLRRLGRNPD